MNKRLIFINLLLYIILLPTIISTMNNNPTTKVLTYVIIAVSFNIILNLLGVIIKVHKEDKYHQSTFFVIKNKIHGSLKYDSKIFCKDGECEVCDRESILKVKKIEENNFFGRSQEKILSERKYCAEHCKNQKI